MKKSSGRIAINHILSMMQEDEHISEEFKSFIDTCLSEYLYKNKLNYSLTSIFKFEAELIGDGVFEQIVKDRKERDGEK